MQSIVRWVVSSMVDYAGFGSWFSCHQYCQAAIISSSIVSSSIVSTVCQDRPAVTDSAGQSSHWQQLHHQHCMPRPSCCYWQCWAVITHCISSPFLCKNGTVHAADKSSVLSLSLSWSPHCHCQKVRASPPAKFLTACQLAGKWMGVRLRGLVPCYLDTAEFCHTVAVQPDTHNWIGYPSFPQITSSYQDIWDVLYHQSSRWDTDPVYHRRHTDILDQTSSVVLLGTRLKQTQEIRVT